ncbi:MAG: hypothetical protein WHV67_04660 [Thermoanaerobaculia bacterium]
MKPKKVAVLDISNLEGETFKNFITDHPLSGIDFFYFQDKEITFTRSSEGASLILEENLEALQDFPLVIDFKKERKDFYEIEGSTIFVNLQGKGTLIFYGLNHQKLKEEPHLKTPHPFNCLFFRFLEYFKTSPPEMVFCNAVLSTSEEGREGQDELYNQTVALLNLSSYKKKIYKGQIAFNISMIDNPNFQRRIEEEISFFFENSFPFQIQIARSGTFFGTVIFLNIIFSKPEDRENYKEWLSKKEDFIFNLKSEGIVEAVQEGKVFVKFKEEEEKRVLGLQIYGDPLYSGMAYNLSNLTEEFFKGFFVLK